jgi:multiple sugar transport system substrate-binding protein
MRKLFCIIAAMLMCAVLLSSCSKKEIAVPDGKFSDFNKISIEEGSGKVKSSDSDKLVIWGYDPIWDDIKEHMKKKFPKLELEIIDSGGDITNDLMDRAAAGNAPDVVLLKAEFRSMGKIHYLDVLEDLLKPPYNAKEIIGDITKSQLSFVMSPNGKKLNGLPMIQHPSVAFYRKDIFQKYGFPTDPDELGKYMEQPENWLKIAKELKKHDHWIAQWYSEPLDIYFKNRGFYDNNFKYIRSGQNAVRMMNVTRAVKENELASYLGIWDASGQEAVRSGKMAMVYIGCWGEQKLKEWAPNTKGLWRVTKLPFGANAFDGFHVLGITKDSKHKKEAWEFIKTVIKTEKIQNDGKINQKSDFLGGQQSQKLYSELRKKLPEVYFTPLETKMEGIFNIEIQNYCGLTYSDMDDLKAMGFIENRIYETYKKELNILKNYAMNRK